MRATAVPTRRPLHRTLRAWWDEYEDVCTYLPLGQLPEAAGFFFEFDALPQVTQGTSMARHIAAIRPS